MHSSASLDTTPIHVKTPGILELDVMVYPQTNGEVQVRGYLSFAVSRTVDQAMSFLPPIVRWGLSASLIHSELKDTRFRFKVANLTTVDTELSASGVLTMHARYHNLLARPVGHSETSRIFRRFATELERSGLTPGKHCVIEDFLSNLTRHDRGELPFLQIFEGRAIVTPERSTPPITGLNLQSFEMVQNSQGDLVVNFEALGQIEGFEELLAG